MGLFKKKMVCPCPSWYVWLVLVVGLVLALSDMGILNLRGLGWGPIAIVLFALGCLFKK